MGGEQCFHGFAEPRIVAARTRSRYRWRSSDLSNSMAARKIDFSSDTFIPGRRTAAASSQRLSGKEIGGSLWHSTAPYVFSDNLSHCRCSLLAMRNRLRKGANKAICHRSRVAAGPAQRPNSALRSGWNMPNASAASSTVKLAKNRSLTSVAASRSTSASFVSASSRHR